MKRAALFLLLSLAPPSAVADGFVRSLPPCDPPTSGDLREVAAWAAQIDDLRQRYLREASPGDVVLGAGPVVAANCFAGVPAAGRPKVVREFEEMVARTLAQAYRCDQVLGLPAVGETVGLLRRAKFDCQALKDSKGKGRALRNANAGNDLDGSYQPLHSLFVRTNTGYERKPLLLVSSEEMTKQSAAGRAEFVLHELLHSTASNNRSWHLKDSRSNLPSGCAGSRYEDRVYMVAAACSPSSEGSGRDFYRKRYVDCPDLCERTLTEVDPDMQSIYRPAGGWFSVTGRRGRTLVAQPLKPDQARRTCGRLREVWKTRREMQDERQTFVALVGQVEKAGYFPSDEGAPSGELRRRLADLRGYVLRAYDGKDPASESLARIRKARGEFEAFLTGQCAPAPATDHPWYSLCLIQGAPLLGAADRATALVSAVLDRERKRARDGEASLEQIADFFR